MGLNTPAPTTCKRQFRGESSVHMNSTLLAGIILILATIFAGCIVPIPVPVPVQVAPQNISIPPQVTFGQDSQPSFEDSLPTTTVVEETIVTTVPETPPIETPSPIPTIVFTNTLSRGTAYAYADNQDFHAVSVAVRSTQMRSGFYYASGVTGSQPIHAEAAEGEKFLMIGVDFYMTGIRKEGKSSQFMTPVAGSFQLVHDGISYGALNASDFPGMTDYYIRDVGSMYRDQFITKDDDGSGILIYEVPQSVDTADAYLTFCPTNLASWALYDYYRSPDNWDCAKNLVVWTLK
jgi:hypothetical protein